MLLLIVPLVVLFLSFAETDFKLRSPAGEVQPEGHDGKAFAVYLADQSLQFPLMHEEFAGPTEWVVVSVSGLPRLDVRAHEVRLVRFVEADVGFGDGRLPLTQRFDFGPTEDQPGFPGVGDEEVMSGPAVDRNVLFAGLIGLLRHEAEQPSIARPGF